MMMIICKTVRSAAFAINVVKHTMDLCVLTYIEIHGIYTVYTEFEIPGFNCKPKS